MIAASLRCENRIVSMNLRAHRTEGSLPSRRVISPRRIGVEPDSDAIARPDNDFGINRTMDIRRTTKSDSAAQANRPSHPPKRKVTVMKFCADSKADQAHEPVTLPKTIGGGESVATTLPPSGAGYFTFSKGKRQFVLWQSSEYKRSRASAE